MELTEAQKCQLLSQAESYFAASCALARRYFAEVAPQMAQACWAMAKRFYRGGKLIAFGTGANATDASHVAVEFVHPVLVGKRALPAITLTADSPSLLGLRHRYGTAQPFAVLLRSLATPHDIAMGISLTGDEPEVVEALLEAQRLRLLTIGLTGKGGGQIAQMGLDFLFAVPSDDPRLVQEMQETLYHILWELVHVFFEQRGLLEGDADDPTTR
jgi:D-sedoheptulose 7-phosphate isomerase